MLFTTTNKGRWRGWIPQCGRKTKRWWVLIRVRRGRRDAWLSTPPVLDVSGRKGERSRFNKYTKAKLIRHSPKGNVPIRTSCPRYSDTTSFTMSNCVFLYMSNSLPPSPPPRKLIYPFSPQFTALLPSLWKKIGTCRRRQLGRSNAMELHMGVGFPATVVFYRCLVQCSWMTKTGNLKSPRRN